MTDLSILRNAFGKFSGMTESAFNLSQEHWENRIFHKGEFFNKYKSVCSYMGFVVSGIFRAFYVSSANGEEKNVFFFSDNQIVVAYRSFLHRKPCSYFIEAMTDAEVFYIHYDDLMKLYEQSHEWERFGRFVAEKLFNMAMMRTENFMFLSPEQRYRNLISEHPNIFNAIPLYHIASYLGIKGPSLSRIRKRMVHNLQPDSVQPLIK